jgi:DNA uptake protein ComE-like DNA-binding protein
MSPTTSPNRLSGVRWSLALSLLLVATAGKARFTISTVDSARAYTPTGTRTPLTWGEAIDINDADESVLVSLPGIGPSTAINVVLERQAFGEYQTTLELRRASGIGKKSVQKLGLLIAVNNPAPRPPIFLNHASERVLERLPGVGPVLAKRIHDARPFGSFSQLNGVRGIGAKTIAKWVEVGVSLSAPVVPSRQRAQTQ